MVKALHRCGDIEVVRYRWSWRDCEWCGNRPAQYCVTYLLPGARRNPASRGYRKDDISRCSDEEAYTCRLCKQKTERYSPHDELEWCSTYPLSSYQHMGWERRLIKDIPTTAAHREEA